MCVIIALNFVQVIVTLLYLVSSCINVTFL